MELSDFKIIRTHSESISTQNKIIRKHDVLCSKCDSVYTITSSNNKLRVKYNICKKCISEKKYKCISREKLYFKWKSMIHRTTKSNSKKDILNYQNRGISVCEQWKSNYENFKNWALENGYKDGLTIDRKNNDLGYFPENCRFVSTTVQNRNTRLIHSTNTTGYRGVTKLNKQRRTKNFVARIKVNKKQICIGYYKCRLECAYAYDRYIIKNKLEHPTNLIKKDY